MVDPSQSYPISLSLPKRRLQTTNTWALHTRQAVQALLTHAQQAQLPNVLINVELVAQEFQDLERFLVSLIEFECFGTNRLSLLGAEPRSLMLSFG